MKIEIWSDFVCPFCYIGKRKMEIALDRFSHKDNVTLVYRSYELDPQSEKNPNMNMHALLAKRYNTTIEKAKEMNVNMKEQAKEVSLTYHFDTIQHTNTLDAHRLAKYASKEGKGQEITEALLYAYFTDSKNISHHKILADIASSVGLLHENVMALLQSTKYQRRVREDEETAKEMGVQSVPFFVFNEKYAVSGVQPVDVFLEVLENVYLEEEGEATFQKQSETTYCTGEGCEVKPHKSE